MQTTLLAVPFQDKDSVKALGAHWDTAISRWCISMNESRGPFAAWLPQTLSPTVQCINKIYLLASNQLCWKCQHTTMVYCVATTKILDIAQDKIKTGFFTFYHIQSMDEAISKAISQKTFTYSYNFSPKQKFNYWLNHCQCNAKIDDTVLHKTRGGAFTPRDQKHSETIHVMPLDDLQDLKLTADYQNKKRLREFVKTREMST